MSNRKERRALAAFNRRQRPRTPAEAKLKEIQQEAQGIGQDIARRREIVGLLDEALRTASQLRDKPSPEAEEGDAEPNERAAMIAHLDERINDERELLVNTILDAVDVLKKFDEPAPLIESVPAIVVPA